MEMKIVVPVAIAIIGILLIWIFASLRPQISTNNRIIKSLIDNQDSLRLRSEDTVVMTSSGYFVVRSESEGITIVPPILGNRKLDEALKKWLPEGFRYLPAKSDVSVLIVRSHPGKHASGVTDLSLTIRCLLTEFGDPTQALSADQPAA